MAWPVTLKVLLRLCSQAFDSMFTKFILPAADLIIRCHKSSMATGGWSKTLLFAYFH